MQEKKEEVAAEKKKEEKGKEEENKKKEEEKEEIKEIVLKVDMHCEACARKVARALKGFQGFLLYFLQNFKFHYSFLYFIYLFLFNELMC